MKTATFNEVPNEYDKAVRVLKDKMRPDIYQRFINTSDCALLSFTKFLFSETFQFY